MKITAFLDGGENYPIIGVAENGEYYYFFDPSLLERDDEMFNDFKALNKAWPKGTKLNLERWKLQVPKKSIKYLANIKD